MVNSPGGFGDVNCNPNSLLVGFLPFSGYLTEAHSLLILASRSHIDDPAADENYGRVSFPGF